MRKTMTRFSAIAVLLAIIYGYAADSSSFPFSLGGGVGGGDQIGAAVRGLGAIFNAAKDISDDQEYFLGRSVSAQILAEKAYSKIYEIKNSPQQRPVTKYINNIGHAIAIVSDRPETYGGYHFFVIDSPELNAFAAPGGNISITTGLLNVTRSEDEIAAILAHEIIHVVKKHGIGAIKSSRWKGAAATLVLEGAKEAGSEDVKELVSLFDGAVLDIKQTLISNSYSSDRENEADSEGVSILARAGYNPGAMASILESLSKITSEDQKGGWLQEHADFETRIENIKNILEENDLKEKPSSDRKDRHTRIIALLKKIG